jgi:hypothetical protein
VRRTSEFGDNPGLLQDIVAMLSQRKKWYLIPVAVAVLLFGFLIALGGTAAAPFIYTLF